MAKAGDYVGKVYALSLEHPKIQKQALPVTFLVKADNLAPVLLGLGVGIIFLGVIALFSSQSQSILSSGPLISGQPPRQFGEAAIKIALQNSKLQEEFRAKELVVAYYTDWGVRYSNYDCPMNQCALVIFADKTEPERQLVSIFVNMNSRKVATINAVVD